MKFKSIAALMLAACSLSAMAEGYKDGVEYYKAGRIELAHELLSKNLNNAGTDKSESYYYLGLIQLDYYSYDMRRGKTADAQKELAEAADFFNRGMQANPDYAFNYAGLGQVALYKNNIKEAEENMKKAEKLAQKDAGVYAAIARAYYNAGVINGNPGFYQKQIDKALGSAEKLMYKRITAAPGKADFQPNDQDYYILRGDMIFATAGADSKLVGDACNEYEEAIRVNPTDGAAYVKYADTYFDINAPFSIAKLKELLQQAPGSALGQRELAEKLYKDGQVAQATAEYAKLMKNPNHFKSDENRYLELLYFSKDFQTGLAQANAMVASDPSQFGARSWSYVFAHELKDPNVIKIAADLLKAQKETGGKLPYGVYPMIARDYNEAGMNDEAINVLQLGLSHYPDNLEMLKETASALAAIDRYAEAADMLSSYIAKQNDPTGTEYWTLSQYAVVAGQEAQEPGVQGKYFELSKEAALKAEPKLAGQFKYLVHKRLGDIAQISKQDAVAASEYLQALKLMEDNNVVNNNANDAKAMYRFAGIAAYNNKDFTTATQLLNKYLALNPDDQQIKDILAKIKK
ncbi:MAG: hypothetical protein HDS66_06110 [Bacteroidales bacterium]|nr:hypothetical protein [Bacteroidales bacterium]